MSDLFARGIGLLRDADGKAMLKLALITCLVAIAVAKVAPVIPTDRKSTTRADEKSVNELRSELPETLKKITEAMGG